MLTICTEAETVGETVATSSPLDAAAAAASINKSINNCESCSQCSQPAYPRPLFSPLSFLFLVQLSLAVRPSFIRIFQLTFKRRVFPLRESGPQLSDGRQPARPERPFIDGTIRSIFAPLYNNYILSATATAQREKPNGSHSPRATTTTTSSK